MTNLAQMLKQAQEMKTRMDEMQKKLNELEVAGQAGGGMVQVTMTAKGGMRKIKIDPKLIDPNEAEMMEDLIVAAVNDARQKAEQVIAGETEKMMGGLKLPPGINLPF